MDSQSQKIFMNSTKELSEHFRGVTGSLLFHRFKTRVLRHTAIPESSPKRQTSAAIIMCATVSLHGHEPSLSPIIQMDSLHRSLATIAATAKQLLPYCY